MAAIFSPTTSPLATCPFCSKPFRRVGNHLPHCKSRNGADYSCFLAKKTTNKRLSASRKKCSKCNRTFKRLDTHLRNSAMCRIVSDPRPASFSSVSSYEPRSIPATATEESALEPATCSVMRKHRLKLPKTTDEWAEANALLEQLVPKVLVEPDIQKKNDILCDGIYSVFASRFGTKPFHCHSTSNSRYKPHNRTLKRLRKLKIQAQRSLRTAQQEHRSTDEL